MSRVVIVGAGGFGREVVDVVRSRKRGVELVGVVDDAPSPLNLERLRDLDVPFLGDASSLNAIQGEWRYIVAIGDPSTRRRVSGALDLAGWEAADAMVDASATVGGSSHLQPGVVVCAGARISTNVSIGAHSHVNPSATLGHDSRIGNFVSINPGAVISGDTVIDDACLIGAGAVVLQGLTVGTGSVVGAAACVTRSVGEGSTVKGVPAR